MILYEKKSKKEGEMEGGGGEIYDFQDRDRPMRRENQDQRTPESFSIQVSGETNKQTQRVIEIQKIDYRNQKKKREMPDDLNEDDEHRSVLWVELDHSLPADSPFPITLSQHIRHFCISSYSTAYLSLSNGK